MSLLTATQNVSFPTPSNCNYDTFVGLLRPIGFWSMELTEMSAVICWSRSWSPAN